MAKTKKRPKEDNYGYGPLMSVVFYVSLLVALAGFDMFHVHGWPMTLGCVGFAGAVTFFCYNRVKRLDISRSLASQRFTNPAYGNRKDRREAKRRHGR